MGEEERRAGMREVLTRKSFVGDYLLAYENSAVDTMFVRALRAAGAPMSRHTELAYEAIREALEPDTPKAGVPVMGTPDDACGEVSGLVQVESVEIAGGRGQAVVDEPRE